MPVTLSYGSRHKTSGVMTQWIILGEIAGPMFDQRVWFSQLEYRKEVSSLLYVKRFLDSKIILET